MPKKPASNQDWHRADIVAAFRKRGTTLARHSRQQGYTSTWLAQATGRPYPKAERVIAEFLNTKPEVIWPSRYNTDGTPKSGRGERGIGRHYTRLNDYKRNDTPLNGACNVEKPILNKQAA